MRLAQCVSDELRRERGIALPLALLTLLLLTSLSMVFATLARTEPTIATNQLWSAQARAMAESGVERALWALSDATAPGAFGGTGSAPNIIVATAASAPYDGAASVPVDRAGGFVVTITGSDRNMRAVRSQGWSPADVAARSQSKSEAVVTLARLANLAGETPCVLCVAATLTIGDATTIDARASDASDCGSKVAAASSADLTIDVGARLFGAGAPAGDAATNAEGRDWLRGQPLPRLTPDDLDTVRALASARGTYRRPASNGAIDLAGVLDGLVFVDSPSGANVITAVDHATVRVGSGFSASPVFSGWIVVNGDVALDGPFGEIRGVVYAANTVTVTNAPAGRVRGIVVAAHALGEPAATVGGFELRFDCVAARGSGLLPRGWFVRPGSYCDQISGC